MSDADRTGQVAEVERIVDAPTELVWAMWTVPDHFRQWYGPFGASVPVADMEVRVGGARRICMEIRTPDGPQEMWFAGTYLEVVPLQRLVYTDVVTDEDGTPQPPPGHPPSTEVRVEMSDAGAGRTRVVVTHVGIPSGSPGARGWEMALDALATLAAQAASEPPTIAP